MPQYRKILPPAHRAPLVNPAILRLDRLSRAGLPVRRCPSVSSHGP